ncbi:MAG: ATP-binding cassette domain-containing protein, partial [Thermoproteota archaeon]
MIQTEIEAIVETNTVNHMLGETLIQATGLWKTYNSGSKHTVALNDVNIHVKEEEIVCLLGPNGAGKTTLVKILSTLLLPDRGRAMVMGYDVVSQGDRVRKVIGYA